MIDKFKTKTNTGLVPSDWNKIKMENIITEVTRFSNDDNIPLYSLTINDGLICKPEKYEREFLVKNEENNYKIIEKDEFALNPMNLRFGAISKMKDSAQAKVSKYYNIFKCNELVDSDFLEMFLRSERVLNYYNRMATGTLEEKKRVHFSQFSQFEFYLPSLIEQKKIAEILSTWDLAIEKQEKLIEKKKEFKKGLMQRLLSGEVRFKEFSDEWKTYKINKLVKQITKKNKENKVSLVLSVTNKRGFITQEEQFEKQVASKDLSNYKIVTKGEFAYNPSRINVGSIDLLKTFEEGLLSPMYVIFKCNENILSKYLLYWINTSTFTNQMNKYLSGSVRETLSFDDMGLMKIKLPTIEEQEVIVNVLETADKEIELLEKELEALKLQKKGLMQRLLTGEVRVKI